MNIENMTPEQLRKLADSIEEEQNNKVVKIGYLKHDLYINYSVRLPENHTFIYTKKTFDKFIDKIKNEFDILKKGTKFICFFGEDGWFDNINYGLECLDDKWAEENLERIEEINE